MTNKRRFNLWQWMWLQVWNLSEWSGIGLGRFASWVFHQMIGCNYPVKKIKSEETEMSKDVIERLQNRIKKQLTNFESIRFSESEGKELLELLKRLADYEIIINAYHQDDADWHKLADINGSAICALVDGIINLQSKLSEYENMEPISIYNLADGEIYKSINDIGDGKSVFAVNLYPHPNK